MLKKKIIPRCFWRNLIITSFVTLYALKSSAQDSLLYKKAVYYAAEGKHAKARALCSMILTAHPDQTAAAVLLGRLYSWDRDFDSSRKVLLEVLRRRPDNIPALTALTNTELWSNHRDKALEYCNRALIKDSTSEILSLKKAEILRSEEKYGEAENILKKILQANPGNTSAALLLHHLKRENDPGAWKNEIGLSYLHDSFNKIYSPWNYTSAHYLHKGRFGAVSGSINYANRFQVNGVQYEIHGYPKITHSLHAYINAGYSGSVIFPHFNFGSIVYYKISRPVELGIGMEYLNFTVLPQPIIAYTGTVIARYKKFRIAFTPYIIPVKAGTDQSYYLSARYYLHYPAAYLTLTLNTGLSPRDYFDPALHNSIKFASRAARAKLDFQTPLFSNRNILKLAVAYEKRGYRQNINLERVTLGVGLERFF